MPPSSPNLLLGPLLGLEGEAIYSVCFLTAGTVQDAQVALGGITARATSVAKLPGDTQYWRAEIELEVPTSAGRWNPYHITLDQALATDANGRTEWCFYQPAADEEPRFAYLSCNGATRTDLLTELEHPFQLWGEFVELHRQSPFALMVLGGDQLYADGVWDQVDSLDEWSSLDRDQKVRKPADEALSRGLDEFYFRLYRSRWRERNMSLMFASVPSVMMWDDHDIFDGWGSFEEDLQNCPVFQEIFRFARKYFELFQIRTSANRSLLCGDRKHYSYCLRFRGYTFLVLDNRSNRRISQVMDAAQWQQFKECLRRVESGTLFLLTAVPVVYRDYSLTETFFDITPWKEELEDDMKDQWRAEAHREEREQLILALLDNARRRHCEAGATTLILSGDVHLGCVGVIEDRRTAPPIMVHQIVSSGIVHPAPGPIEWLGICSVTSDEPETLGRGGEIEARLVAEDGAEKYIRARNFAVLERQTDGPMRVTWIVEQGSARAKAMRQYLAS